jgi:protein tyrosine/serine phosphatase
MRPLLAFRSLNILLAAIALRFFVSSSMRAQSVGADPPAAYTPAKKLRLAGISNFGEVAPTLFRGGQPTSQGFASLAKRGIDIVIDLRRQNSGDKTREEQEVAANDMKFVSLSWDCHHPSDEIAARFLRILRDNPGKRVFVHCHYGVHRTGALIAVYRMAEDGWTSAEAMKEMKLFGYNILHRTWCHSLAGFEANFPRQMKTDPRLRSLSTGASPAR